MTDQPAGVPASGIPAGGSAASGAPAVGAGRQSGTSARRIVGLVGQRWQSGPGARVVTADPLQRCQARRDLGLALYRTAIPAQARHLSQ